MPLLYPCPPFMPLHKSYQCQSSNACDDVITDTVLGAVTFCIHLTEFDPCAYSCTPSTCVCVCVHSGVSLPSSGLWHLPAMWLLPSGFLFTFMWPRDRPVPVQAWRDWSPVQHMRQPLRRGHKFRLWRWECFFHLFQTFWSNLWKLCICLLCHKMTLVYPAGGCIAHLFIICLCAQHHISDTADWIKKKNNLKN